MMKVAIGALMLAAGSAAWGQVGVPGTKVEDLEIVDYTVASVVTLEWTAPKSNVVTTEEGEATAYEIRWANGPISTSTWDAAFPVAGEPLPASPGSLESFSADIPAAHGVELYVAMKVLYGSIWTGLSNVPMVIPDLVAPPAVDDLAVATALSTTTSLTLTFTEPGDDDGQSSTAAVNGLDLRYSTSAITPANFNMATPLASVVPLGAGKPHSHIVTSLLPLTTYYFAVRSWDTPNVPLKTPNYSLLSTGTTSGLTVDPPPPAAGGDDGSSDSSCGGTAAAVFPALAWPLLLSVALARRS